MRTRLHVGTSRTRAIQTTPRRQQRLIPYTNHNTRQSTQRRPRQYPPTVCAPIDLTIVDRRCGAPPVDDDPLPSDVLPAGAGQKHDQPRNVGRLGQTRDGESSSVLAIVRPGR